MKKIIAITNQKGGVGKTTTAVNLSAALSNSKYKVLLIDLDPQGNATTGSNVDKKNIKNTINEVLLIQIDIKKSIIHNNNGYDFIPSNIDLTEASTLILKKPTKECILKDALESIKDEYDFIFIDCPPALSILTLNAFVAAHSVMIPIQCEYYAMEGLADLIETIEQIKQLNPKLKIEGILRVMFDVRSKLGIEVSNNLKEYFQDKLYQTYIPRNISLAEAPSFGKDIYSYNKRSKGALAYENLKKEFISQNE